jgi:hypothetical protein
MNTVKALNILLELKKTFDNLGIIFWLDGGTLLGAYRENGFMDSDFDVDIGMLGDDDTHIADIIGNLKEKGFDHFHLKQHPCGEGKQISFVKDGIPGDIFIYYKRGDRRFRVMFDIDRCGTVKFIPCLYPASIFENYQKIDFMDYGIEFNMPSPVEEYLTLQYGDWKTDKSKDEFHWQTDYKSMDMSFPIYDKPVGYHLWLLTETIKSEDADGSFFAPLIREGYKIYPIQVGKGRRIIDGRKRLSAYKQLGVPMVECIYDTTL